MNDDKIAERAVTGAADGILSNWELEKPGLEKSGGAINMGNQGRNMRENRGVVAAIALCYSLTAAYSVRANDQMPPQNAPAFSDPEVLAPVPNDWSSRPLERDPAHRDADLVVALGQQTHPIFKDLIPEYARQRNLDIVVKHGTCGITAGRLRKKSVNVGAYCCPPGQNDRLPGLEFHSLGISPIALIVHPDNPLEDITLQQAREIFRGQLTHWTKVSSDDAQKLDRLVQPIGRLHCKIRPGHWLGLLGDEDQFSPRLFEVGVIPDMISQVAKNPSAIGWEVPLMVSYHREKGAVRMLKINGREPTDLEYVASGQYPFYRTYHLTTWQKDDKAKHVALELIRYLQQYIEDNYEQVGYVSPSQLKQAGWKFRGDELIGEPDEIRTADY